MKSQKQLLDDLLSEVSSATIVVFDLDDTLFSTSDRHLRIIAEYAATIELTDERSARLLRAIRRESLRYSILDTAQNTGLDETLARDLRDFWFARFFTNSYLLEDSIIPGGPEYVAEVLKRGGRAFYLTGRDESMRAATETSLLRRGFPAPDGTSVALVLKPRFDALDLAFKNEALTRIAGMGTVVGSFENEPAHVNLFIERFRQGRHFLLETKHSGKPIAPRAETLRIKNFLR